MKGQRMANGQWSTTSASCSALSLAFCFVYLCFVAPPFMVPSSNPPTYPFPTALFINNLPHFVPGIIPFLLRPGRAGAYQTIISLARAREKVS